MTFELEMDSRLYRPVLEESGKFAGIKTTLKF